MRERSVSTSRSHADSAETSSTDPKSAALVSPLPQLNISENGRSGVRKTKKEATEMLVLDVHGYRMIVIELVDPGFITPFPTFVHRGGIFHAVNVWESLSLE
jgi:hypothetical protein